MKLFIRLFVLYSLTLSSAQAQDVVVLATGRYGVLSFSPDADNEDISIPMRRVQNLFLIEAVVDGQRGNFILDTGAPGIVLNMAYFQTGRQLESASSYGVTGGGAPVYRYFADSLDIQGLIFRKISANVADLGHIENARGVKILGLLGAGLFQQMEMELDMENSFLGLYHIDRDGERVNQQILPEADLSIPLEYSSSLIFVRGYIAGKKLRFVLDTGAETNVLSTNVSGKVIEKVRLNNLTTLKGSGANTVQVASGNLPELTIAGTTFNDLPFVLTDLSQLEDAYGTTMDGMLGYSFLSTGVMILNPRKKSVKVYFYKEDK